MKLKSKRYLNLLNKFNYKQKYNIIEAIFLLFNLKSSRFTETAEFTISLKQKLFPIKEVIKLPFFLRKNQKIAILTSDKSIFLNLYNKGAYLVGYENILKSLETNNITFDILLTTKKYLPELLKYKSLLNFLNLMPKKSNGTLISNLEESLINFLNGKVLYCSDKDGNITGSFGNTNFSKKELLENILEIYKHFEKSLYLKKLQIKSKNICLTNSPSIKIKIN